MKILKFYSPSCGPCKALDNNLKAAGIEYTSINAEEDDALVALYNVRNIPTLLKVDNNKVIARNVGVMSVEQLKEWCK